MRIQIHSLLILFLLSGITVISFAQRVKNTPRHENLLAGTEWKVDGNPFETETRETYNFSRFDASTWEGHWGHFIRFDDDTFSSNYAAPCGNDCFTSISGEYYFKAAFKIHVKVASITRGGFCSEKSETPDKSYGYYQLERTDFGWKLTKV